MKKLQRTGFQVHPRYIQENGKNRDMKLYEALAEGFDNSIAAGANTIIFTKESQKKGELHTITFEDNGNGIPSDKMLSSFNTFGYRGNYDKKSTSLFGVGFKEMISYLCIYGQIDIVSIHNGTKSKLNINFSEDENDFGFSEVKTESTTESNGTIIKVTNVDMSIDDDDKDKVDLEQWLGCVYCITKQNNPNFKIVLRTKEKNSEVYESKELQFFDPMYRDISILNPHAINKILDNEKYDIGGEEVTMSIYQYNREIFNNEDLFSSFDRKTSKKGGLLKGKFIYKKCGIYWRLGNRYSNFGFGNFISMNAQHTLDNVRIEIKIEGPKLMKLFNVNQNKSRVSAPNYKQINKVSGLKKLIDDLTKHVTALHNLSTDKTKEVTSVELDECETIEKQLNTLGDICGITKGGELPPVHIPEESKIKDNRIYENTIESFKLFCENNKLVRNSVEECKKIDESLYSVRDIEYAFRDDTFIRHKISSPVERGPFKLRYVNGHKKDDFIKLVGMNDKKYVFECNKSHPYYEYCYSKLDSGSKFLIVVNYVSLISTLLVLQNEKDIDKETSDRVLELNNQSLESLVYKLQNKIPNLTF
jgi:hypothetical protein